mgnify:CR=1 FL=1
MPKEFMGKIDLDIARSNPNIMYALVEAEAPDGALYFCTSNRDGGTTPAATDDRIARIIPIQ